MARTCVLTVDDSTPTSGQDVTVTATFSNDGDAVDIDVVEQLTPAAQAAFLQQMKTALEGRTLAPEDGSPVETAFTFKVVAFNGEQSDKTTTLVLDLQAFLSDGTNINATGVTLTVSPPTLPGDAFPWS